MRSGRSRRYAAVIAALAALTAGCGDDSGGDDGPYGAEESPDEGEVAENTQVPPAEGSVEVVETVAENLDSPWGVVALPGGDLLVGSRDEAVVQRVNPEDGSVTEVGSVPDVAPDGEGGLLGLALHAEDDDGQWLYAYHTAPDDNRIVRMELTDGGDLGGPEVVLDGIPRDAHIHHGGALAFGPDGLLYAATGDSNEPELAQDPDSLAGKILRMTPDGDEPEDGNPLPDSLVYSLGHRNVQGLAWDGDDRLWATEFGADDWDEINHIEPGENYGWPHHEGTGGEEEGYVDPVVQWEPAEASPSGLAHQQGSLWAAALRGERLWRIPLEGAEPLADPQAFLEGDHGRLRAVLAAGDDELLLVTNETDTRGDPEEGDDRILRLRVT